MFIVLAQITLIVVCALALCLYVGWGATNLSSSVGLGPFAALLTPLIGYALTIWFGYMGVSTALNLRWSLALLLALATALNTVAWRRGARPHPIVTLREHAALLALLVVTLLVGLLPLLHYGYLTTIGQGWDTESYLPMAQHLSDYPLVHIPDAPISPLRELVRDPPRIGVTLGFSVFHGMTMLLSGQSALASFVPLLALLRTIGILAIYVWLHATMGLGRRAALVGATGASVGALLLWVSYFNFGMQLAAWPLLALGLTLGLAAVEELARRGLAAWPLVLVGGIVLAALPVAYYPALTLWVPIALGLGAARLVESLQHDTSEPGLGRLFLATLGLGTIVLVLAALPVQDYFEGFSFRYSLPAQHVGPDRFIAPTDTLGLTAFRLPDSGPQPPGALVLIAAIIAAGLAVAGLALPTNDSDHRSSLAVGRWSAGRLRWIGVIGAALAYLGWLRFGRPYEYAYMKGSAYAGFVAWGLIALGWQLLRDRVRPRIRPFVTGLALAPLMVAGWAQALTIADHWAGPAIFTRDIATFDRAATQVPAGATVAITSDAAFTGPNSGLFSAILYGHEIWGHLVTAYAGLDYWPTGRLPQFALLAAEERPWPLALGGQEVWRSGAAALYRLDDRVQTLRGRAAFYSAAPPTDRGAPAALAIWRRGGPYRSASHDAPLMLSVGDSLSFGAGHAQGAAHDQQVYLTVASLMSQTVTLGYSGREERVAVAAGVNRIDLRVAAPAELTLTPDERLALIDAGTEPTNAAATPPTVQLGGDQLAWSVAAEQRGATTDLRLDLANPGRHALRVGLIVVEDTFERPHRALRLLAAAPISGTWRLQADLARGATQAIVGKTPTPLLALDAAPNPPDGAYFGVLTLYDGEEAVAHAPIFTLRVGGGKVVAFDPVPFTVEATPLGTGSAPLPSTEWALLERGRALDGGAATLEGALLQHQPLDSGADRAAPLQPADPLTVRLSWRAERSSPQPLMVSVQLLSADDHKWAQWDGPLGGDWRPIQSWSVGDRVRQDVPLALDPTTPPGSYRLLLVVYDPATGQPQSFGGQKALPLGEVGVR